MLITRYNPLPYFITNVKLGRDFNKSMLSHKMFINGRTALYYFLKQISLKYPKRKKVLVSAFICASVIEVIKSLGLEIEPLDVERGSIFQNNDLLAQKVDGVTLAVLLAPYFGLIPKDNFRKLKESINFYGSFFILDLAQCFGCSLSTLSADAIIISYGIGKGVDYYGGSLLADKNIAAYDVETKEEDLSAFFVRNLLLSVKLSILCNKFLYRFFKDMIDSEVNRSKSFKAKDIIEELSEISRNLIKTRAVVFNSRIELSKKRARELYDLEAFKKYLLPETLIDFDSSTFLRFPFFVPGQLKKEWALNYFKKYGIEVTDAKEDYFNSLSGLRLLNSRIVKLPFLGALTQNEFDYLKTIIADFVKLQEEAPV